MSIRLVLQSVSLVRVVLNPFVLRNCSSHRDPGDMKARKILEVLVAGEVLPHQITDIPKLWTTARWYYVLHLVGGGSPWVIRYLDEVELEGIILDRFCEHVFLKLLLHVSSVPTSKNTPTFSSSLPVFLTLLCTAGLAKGYGCTIDQFAIFLLFDVPFFSDFETFTTFLTFRLVSH